MALELMALELMAFELMALELLALEVRPSEFMALRVSKPKPIAVSNAAIGFILHF